VETPFANYQNYLKKLGDSIEVVKLSETKRELSLYIQKMWEVVERVSPTITKRRAVFTKAISPAERNKVTINKNFVQEFLNRVSQGIYIIPLEDMYTLSPLPLASKIYGGTLGVNLNLIRIVPKKILIKDITKVPDEVLTPLKEFSTIFDLKLGEPTKKKKQSDQQVEDFDEVDHTTTDQV